MEPIEYANRGRAAILRRKRTDETKAKRRLYGDKGMRFNEGHYYSPALDGCSNTITTVAKDNLLIVWNAKY